MIWIRGTGAPSVSFKNPNCRSHSSPIPENTELNSTVIAMMPGAKGLESLAAINALEHRGIWAPNDVRVLGVESDRGVIPGPLP